jgi:hypothetical protein
MLHWHMYRLLRGCTFLESYRKFLFFDLLLINQLRLLGSEQHLQSRVLLSSFQFGEQKIVWRR